MTMINDPIGDMITRMRNGYRVRKPSVVSPNSKARRGVLDVLKREGYIRDYKISVTEGVSHSNIVIELKYRAGESVIDTISRVSKPGCRVYSKIADLKKVNNGLGITVLSTPEGFLSDQEAREKNVGGELICRVS